MLRGRQAPILALVAGLSLALAGCSREKLARQGGQVSQSQADDYLRDAVRKSSEGVVLDPSQQGLEQIERTRLTEIAQQLRGPAAVCFLERAIVTMEAGEVDGEQTWVEVPEGQAKIRARISVDGTVLSTEVLESGFRDEYMDECLQKVIRGQGFVESRDNFAYYIDVYYWVSLGFFAEAQSQSFVDLLRRRQAEAGRKAQGCLTGRVEPGSYTVTGLNLFDRDGRTLINRIERGELPKEVSSCVASVLKQISIHPEPDAFVRPAAPEITFTVNAAGEVSSSDERWLALIELEERAERERKRAELLDEPIGGDPDLDDRYIDAGEPPPPADAIEAPPRGEDDSPPSTAAPPPSTSTPQAKPAPPPTGPTSTPDDAAKDPPAEPPAPADKGDPSEPGVKIDLSPRR